MSKKFKSGFVGIIGRPNVGKSTLLNNVLGQKIAIMSDKAQTTRNKIQGIYTTDSMQAIFFDTPGMHKPKHMLGEYMNKAANSVVGDVDVVFFLVDATAPLGGGDQYIVNHFGETKTPIFLIINKADALPPEEMIKAITIYSNLYNFSEVVPISALKGDNVDRLLEVLEKYLPAGPCYYDEEEITDQPEKQIVAELIREKILLATTDEIPHAIAVEITEFITRPDDTLYIGAAVYVERDSQKGIIIGKGGSMLKMIGSKARPEIENLFGNKVFLDIRVKVKKDWRNDKRTLNNFGFDPRNI